MDISQAPTAAVAGEDGDFTSERFDELNNIMAKSDVSFKESLLLVSEHTSDPNFPKAPSIEEDIDYEGKLFSRVNGVSLAPPPPEDAPGELLQYSFPIRSRNTMNNVAKQNMYAVRALAKRSIEQHRRTKLEETKAMDLILQKITGAAFLLCSTTIMVYCTITMGGPMLLNYAFQSGLIANPAFENIFMVAVESAFPTIHTADLNRLRTLFKTIQKPGGITTLQHIITLIIQTEKEKGGKDGTANPDFVFNLLNFDGARSEHLGIPALLETNHPGDVNNVPVLKAIVDIRFILVKYLLKTNELKDIAKSIGNLSTVGWAEIIQKTPGISESVRRVLGKLNFVFRSARFMMDFSTAEESTNFYNTLIKLPGNTFIDSRYLKRTAQEYLLDRLSGKLNDDGTKKVFLGIEICLNNDFSLFGQTLITKETLQTQLAAATVQSFFNGASWTHEFLMDNLIKKTDIPRPGKLKQVADDDENSPKSVRRRELIKQRMDPDRITETLKEEFDPVEIDNSIAPDDLFQGGVFVFKRFMKNMYRIMRGSKNGGPVALAACGSIGLGFIANMAVSPATALTPKTVIGAIGYAVDPVFQFLRDAIAVWYLSPFFSNEAMAILEQVKLLLSSLSLRIRQTLFSTIKNIGNNTAMLLNITNSCILDVSSTLFMVFEFMGATFWDAIVGSNIQIMNTAVTNLLTNPLEIMQAFTVTNIYTLLNTFNRWRKSFTEEVSITSLLDLAGNVLAEGTMNTFTSNVLNMLETDENCLEAMGMSSRSTYASYLSPLAWFRSIGSFVASISRSLPVRAIGKALLALRGVGKFSSITMDDFKVVAGEQSPYKCYKTKGFFIKLNNGAINLKAPSSILGGTSILEKMKGENNKRVAILHLTMFAQLSGKTVRDLLSGPPPTDSEIEESMRTLGVNIGTNTLDEIKQLYNSMYPVSGLDITQYYFKLMKESLITTIKEELRSRVPPIVKTDAEIVSEYNITDGNWQSINPIENEKISDAFSDTFCQSAQKIQLKHANKEIAKKAFDGISTLLYSFSGITPPSYINKYFDKDLDESIFIGINQTPNAQNEEIDLEVIDAIDVSSATPEQKRLNTLFGKNGKLRSAVEDMKALGNKVYVNKKNEELDLTRGTDKDWGLNYNNIFSHFFEQMLGTFSTDEVEFLSDYKAANVARQMELRDGAVVLEHTAHLAGNLQFVPMPRYREVEDFTEEELDSGIRFLQADVRFNDKTEANLRLSITTDGELRNTLLTYLREQKRLRQLMVSMRLQNEIRAFQFLPSLFEFLNIDMPQNNPNFTIVDKWFTNFGEPIDSILSSDPELQNPNITQSRKYERILEILCQNGKFDDVRNILFFLNVAFDINGTRANVDLSKMGNRRKLSDEEIDSVIAGDLSARLYADEIKQISQSNLKYLIRNPFFRGDEKYNLLLSDYRDAEQWVRGELQNDPPNDMDYFRNFLGYIPINAPPGHRSEIITNNEGAGPLGELLRGFLDTNENDLLANDANGEQGRKRAQAYIGELMIEFMRNRKISIVNNNNDRLSRARNDMIPFNLLDEVYEDCKRDLTKECDLAQKWEERLAEENIILGELTPAQRTSLNIFTADIENERRNLRLRITSRVQDVTSPDLGRGAASDASTANTRPSSTTTQQRVQGATTAQPEARVEAQSTATNQTLAVSSASNQAQSVGLNQASNLALSETLSTSESIDSAQALLQGIMNALTTALAFLQSFASTSSAVGSSGYGPRLARPTADTNLVPDSGLELAERSPTLSAKCEEHAENIKIYGNTIYWVGPEGSKPKDFSIQSCLIRGVASRGGPVLIDTFFTSFGVALGVIGAAAVATAWAAVVACNAGAAVIGGGVICTHFTRTALALTVSTSITLWNKVTTTYRNEIERLTNVARGWKTKYPQYFSTDGYFRADGFFETNTFSNDSERETAEEDFALMVMFLQSPTYVETTVGKQRMDSLRASLFNVLPREQGGAGPRKYAEYNYGNALRKTGTDVLMATGVASTGRYAANIAADMRDLVPTVLDAAGNIVQYNSYGVPIAFNADKMRNLSTRYVGDSFGPLQTPDADFLLQGEDGTSEGKNVNPYYVLQKFIKKRHVDNPTRKPPPFSDGFEFERDRFFRSLGEKLSTNIFENFRNIFNIFPPAATFVLHAEIDGVSTSIPDVPEAFATWNELLDKLCNTTTPQGTQRQCPGIPDFDQYELLIGDDRVINSSEYRQQVTDSERANVQLNGIILRKKGREINRGNILSNKLANPVVKMKLNEEAINYMDTDYKKHPFFNKRKTTEIRDTLYFFDDIDNLVGEDEEYPRNILVKAKNADELTGDNLSFARKLNGLKTPRVRAFEDALGTVFGLSVSNSRMPMILEDVVAITNMIPAEKNEFIQKYTEFQTGSGTKIWVLKQDIERAKHLKVNDWGQQLEQVFNHQTSSYLTPWSLFYDYDVAKLKNASNDPLNFFKLSLIVSSAKTHPKILSKPEESVFELELMSKREDDVQIDALQSLVRTSHATAVDAKNEFERLGTGSISSSFYPVRNVPNINEQSMQSPPCPQEDLSICLNARNVKLTVYKKDTVSIVSMPREVGFFQWMADQVLWKRYTKYQNHINTLITYNSQTTLYNHYAGIVNVETNKLIRKGHEKRRRTNDYNQKILKAKNKRISFDLNKYNGVIDLAGTILRGRKLSEFNEIVESFRNLISELSTTESTEFKLNYIGAYRERIKYDDINDDIDDLRAYRKKKEEDFITNPNTANKIEYNDAIDQQYNNEVEFFNSLKAYTKYVKKLSATSALSETENLDTLINTIVSDIKTLKELEKKRLNNTLTSAEQASLVRLTNSVQTMRDQIKVKRESMEVEISAIMGQADRKIEDYRAGQVRTAAALSNKEVSFQSKYGVYIQLAKDIVSPDEGVRREAQRRHQRLIAEKAAAEAAEAAENEAAAGAEAPAAAAQTTAAETPAAETPAAETPAAETPQTLAAAAEALAAAASVRLATARERLKAAQIAAAAAREVEAQARTSQELTDAKAARSAAATAASDALAAVSAAVAEAAAANAAARQARAAAARGTSSGGGVRLG